ncbi:MAG: NAD kinase [Vicingus serpentipes]|nr:NAD kinase [Vicingus serpentipes]
MRIAIYGKTISENYISFIQELFQKLEVHQIETIVCLSFYDFLKEKIQLSPQKTFTNHHEIKDVDYLFSIGGDGTLLETVQLVRDQNIPILGINTGRLGYLSSITTNEIDQAVASIMNQNFELDNRTLLSVETISSDFFGSTNYALNEVTIQKKDTSSMITIHVYLNGEFLNSYWADGIIVATPTGSTAYSLSCNGPIVLPDSGNIIITPIAPHNLNVRPLVISDDTSIQLKIEGRTDNFLAAIDSRSVTMPISTEITIKKSTHKVSLIRLKEYNLLNTLRNKLMWGLDKRN